MIEHFYSADDDLRPLRRGLLGPYMDSFAARLAEQGYCKYYGRQKIALVADLSRWLHRKNIRVAELNERRIDVFLAARSKAHGRTGGEKSTLALLLRSLREGALFPQPCLQPFGVPLISSKENTPNS
jgi:hypothetical protein